MTIYHQTLAGGRWRTFSFVEQMANVGSDVGRALSWRERGNEIQSRLAYERALELLDFTLDDPNNRGRLKEIARTRECLVDFFDGTNEYGSSDRLLRNYFDFFAFAARKDR